MDNIDREQGDPKSDPETPPGNTSPDQHDVDAAKTKTDNESTKRKLYSSCYRRLKIGWRQLNKEWRTAKLHDKIIAGATIVIAVVGILQFIVYWQMKGLMQSSGGQTEQLIASQKKIANLQYAAGSPNVRFAYFSLYHEPNGKVWGFVRVRNNGIKYPAEFVSGAVNLEFRSSAPMKMSVGTLGASKM